MLAIGWSDVTRAKRVRTTVADRSADRARTWSRQFRVPATNELLVADFTYVQLRTGAFASTLFAIDAYAGTIVGQRRRRVRQRPGRYDDRAGQDECIRSGSPFRNGEFDRLGDVEDSTSRRVAHDASPYELELGRPGIWLRIDLEKPPSTQMSCPVT